MYKNFDFYSLLKSVQEHISEKYAVLLSDKNDSSRNQLKLYIKQYLLDNNYMSNEQELQSAVDRLFTEMVEFSILTPFLSDKTVEEININSWEDITVHYADGRSEKLDESFFSPDHAIDIVRRLLHESGMILDASYPIVRGHLSNNIRVTVLGDGVVDKDVGVTASIRLVNPQKLSKDDFIGNGTATEEMLDFLSLCLRHDVSMCLTGATGSGKTTLMSWILSTIPYHKRIFTIEENTREFDLVVRDSNGKVLNNVTHTCTRFSEDEKRTITMETLLDTALTYNPDVICVSEMKSDEAWSAQEAARTGHAVITTAHANSCGATYRRLATLGARKYGMSYHEVEPLMLEAFPIVIFTKQLEDNTRRIMEIAEMELCDYKGELRTLWSFDVKKQAFVRCNPVSNSLLKRLRENGVDTVKYQRLLQGATTCRTLSS